MMSQSSKTLLTGLVLGLALVGCKKSDSSDNAVTANTYPAPALSFYSNDPYSGLSYDDSMYLGGREASLVYYENRNVSGIDPNAACMEFYNNGNTNYMAAATASLGGYSSYYQSAGTQRYGSFNAGQGDMIARTRSWYDGQGNAVSTIQGGIYLVCLISSSNYVVPTGMFFMANNDMNGFVNVNMQYSNNMQVRFSQPYFGRQFRVARQFNNYTSRNSDFKPRHHNNSDRQNNRSLNGHRENRQSSRDENRAVTPRSSQRNSETRFETRSSERRDGRDSNNRDSNSRMDGVIQ